MNTIGCRCTVRFISVIFVLISGCAWPRRTFQPPVDPNQLSDEVFVHYLPTVPVVTVDEGMRAVLMLRGRSAHWPSFEEREKELARIGGYKKAWRLAQNQILDKGTLAYMLHAVCELRSSMNSTLARHLEVGERRYALKTCQFEGLIAQGNSYEPITGGELLECVANAEDYLFNHGMRR